MSYEGEMDQVCSLAKKYIYGPGIDNPVAMINVSGASETWYYYYADALGSIRLMSDAGGAIVESAAYDVFGRPRVMTGAGADGNWLTEDAATYNYCSIGNPYLFTGRRWDSVAGLYYYRFRDYSPDLGRFCQTDPLGTIDGLNLYAYCGNNPLSWIDPWGLCKESQEYTGNFWEDFKNALKANGIPQRDALKYGLQEFQNAGSFGLYDKYGLTNAAGQRDAYGGAGQFSKWSARVSVGALYSAVALGTYQAATGFRIELHGTHGGRVLPHAQGIQGPGWGKTIWRFPPH